MPDINCEVFSKVLATLSDYVLDRIPGHKHEFLATHLKPTNVDILTQSEENVVCLVGKLENIYESQSILTKKLLLAEVSALDETKIENNIIEESIELPEVSIECPELKTEQQDGLMLAKLDNDSTRPDVIEPKDLEPIIDNGESSDQHRLRKVTKSGRLVKVPLKLSSDANIILKDEGNVDDGIDENIDDVKVRDKRRRGRPRKWYIAPDNDELVVLKNSNQHNDSDSLGVASDDHNDKGASVDTVFLNKNNVKHKRQTEKPFMNTRNLPADMKYIKKYYEDKLPFKHFCAICSFRTKRQSHFIAHMNLHKRNPNLKLHACNNCDFTTVRLSVLQRHKMSHISDVKELFACQHCDFTTFFSKCLVRHEYKHKKRTVTDYSCSYCSFTTPYKTQYSKHILKHSETDSAEVYQCLKCEYQTKRKINYLRHYRDKHSDHRPHLCDLCGAAFKRTDALHAHKESHIEKSKRILPFVCKLCQKGFRTMAHLVEHKAVHSTERSFQCHICGQMFKTKAVQQRHLRGVHHKTNVDQCNTCKRFFSSKYTLKRHLRQHEGENLPSDGQIKTIQTMMPEGQQTDFVSDEGQIAADEDANAIQTITISSENINDLNQKLQNLSSHIQTIGDIPDVYIQGLENVDANSVSIVNLNGEDIGHILIPSSQSDYTEHVPQLSVTDSTTQNIDTSQQVTSDSVKLFQSLQHGQEMASTSNLVVDSSLNIQLVSIKQDLPQLSSEIVTNSDLVNQVQEAIHETVDVPEGQVIDVHGQIITDGSDGQIVEVVTHDGKTYHLKVNNGGNILSIEDNDQDM